MTNAQKGKKATPKSKKEVRRKVWIHRYVFPYLLLMKKPDIYIKEYFIPVTLIYSLPIKK